MRAPWRRGGPPVPATESKILGTRVRCYDPGPNGRKPALIYLHGGGWTVFSINTHDRIMREYASRAGVSVIGVDYALAPEAKYPVALDQIVGVVKFFAARGFDLAIGGDSAGANLAIATCIRLRDEGQSQLMQAMILNYGVYERHTSPGAPEGILTAAEMEQFWRNYLRDESDANDPRVCPLLGDLRGLPRALLVIAEFDLLTDQSVKLGRQLEKAGVPAQVNFYRGATHSFLEAVSISALASRAFDESAKWLRSAIRSDS